MMKDLKENAHFSYVLGVKPLDTHSLNFDQCVQLFHLISDQPTCRTLLWDP
jgi:hypothetical protein